MTKKDIFPDLNPI